MNSLYDLGRQGTLDGSINYASDTIKAVLAGASYTPNTATDEFLSDIPSGQIIATSPALGGKTETAGVAKAANTTFVAVTGPVADFLVLYKDTGTPTTSRLICIFDTATGLPVTPNGGDITVAWNASGIYKI